MRIIVEIVAAVLFVVSTGLLFSETVRARHILFTLVGIVALASSYVITKTVLDASFGHRIHHRHTELAMLAGPPAQPAAPSPSGAAPAPVVQTSATDGVLEAVYTLTESTLNRVVRAGTKQSSASVSSDTVVDVIVGMTIAVLGLLSQILSGAFRRLTGAG
jgi:hypothetical protein